MSTAGDSTLINYDVLNAYYDSIEEVHIYQFLFLWALLWALCCSSFVCCVCFKYRNVNTRTVEGLVTPADIQKRHETKSLLPLGARK